MCKLSQTTLIIIFLVLSEMCYLYLQNVTFPVPRNKHNSTFQNLCLLISKQRKKLNYKAKNEGERYKRAIQSH